MLRVKCVDSMLINKPHCIDTESVSIQHQDDLIVASCHFFPNDKVDADFDILNIPLPDSLSNAVAKRKGEFLAGRYLANKIIELMGLPDAKVAIDKHKAPIWPAGIMGSISHSKSKALCVITKYHNDRFLGIDIEHWLSPSDAQCLASNIVVNDHEYKMMQPFVTFEQAITLIFSAKESLYKAIFKAFEHYVDFDAAKVTSFDFSARQLTLTLCQALSESMFNGREFNCEFSFDEQSVTTLVFN